MLPAFLLACSSNDLNTTPAVHISKVTGDNQVAEAGNPLPESLVVVLKDEHGTPIVGDSIHWYADPLGAPANVTAYVLTGQDGKAAVVATPFDRAGMGRVLATAVQPWSDSIVEFGFTSHIHGATQIEANGGTGQTDTVRSTMAPYSVLVLDEHNAPVKNVVVTWTVATGGGQLSDSTSKTDSSGIAKTTHTLGDPAAPQKVQAAVDGLVGSPVTFTTTATAGNPTLMLANNYINEVGPVGTMTDFYHGVQLEDNHGNYVPGVTVQWKVGLGGGSVSSTTLITRADGQAYVRRTLGPTPGVNTDTAIVNGVLGANGVFASPAVWTDTAVAVYDISVGPAADTLTFSPTSDTVPAAAYVRFTWMSSGEHTVTWASGPSTLLDAGPGQVGGTLTLRPTAPGTYTYYCTIHGSPTTGMHGSIIVK